MDPGRVTLREAFGWTDYIQALADADLFLDSTPFTGGMTTCDALWVGTPIVTLATPTFAGQQTAALLRAVGAGGHIATSPESYVRGAMRLAADRAGSGPRRDGLRTAFDRSALRDLTGFATRFLDLIEAQFAA